MEAFVEKILTNIISGGPSAMMSILVLICVVLGWWVVRQDRMIEKLNERLQDIVDKKFITDTAVANSLDQLRNTIWELVKSKL